MVKITLMMSGLLVFSLPVFARQTSDNRVLCFDQAVLLLAGMEGRYDSGLGVRLSVTLPAGVYLGAVGAWYRTRPTLNATSELTTDSLAVLHEVEIGGHAHQVGIEIGYAFRNSRVAFVPYLGVGKVMRLSTYRGAEYIIHPGAAEPEVHKDPVNEGIPGSTTYLALGGMVRIAMTDWFVLGPDFRYLWGDGERLVGGFTFGFTSGAFQKRSKPS